MNRGEAIALCQCKRYPFRRERNQRLPRLLARLHILRRAQRLLQYAARFRGHRGKAERSGAIGDSAEVEAEALHDRHRSHVRPVSPRREGAPDHPPLP